ncbi:hypothetical protein V6Z11_D10G104100 [Gossypium hirsutum]
MSFTIGTTSTGFWVLRILLSLSRILLVGALGTWFPRRNTSILLMMTALFLVVLLVACCTFVVIGGFLFFNFRCYWLGFTRSYVRHGGCQRANCTGVQKFHATISR